MGEALSVIMALGMLLAVVTVVGHGIWVLLAALFGQKPPLHGVRPAISGACPRCRSSLDLATHSCFACGWPSEIGRSIDHEAALRSLRQQLARLSELSAVDEESRAVLEAAIKAQQHRLSMLKSAAAPAQSPSASAADEKAPHASLSDDVVSSDVAWTPPRPTHATPAERVRAYTASRQAGAAEPLPEPTPVVPKRREAMSRLLAAFMEEKNIRWGELVGGLLIVGSTIALVISFWSEIAARPMLKFGLLGGVTAALFGVGLYTDRSWRIPTTSHGVLLIATLLVPLNFLAIAAFSQGAAASDVRTLAGEAISAVVFTTLLYLAGKVIAPGAAALVAAGVMVPSLVQLVVRRFAEPGAALATLYGLAAVPVVAYVAITVWRMRRHATSPTDALDAGEAQRLLQFLGVLSAAAVLPLVLLVWKVPPALETIHRLAPLVVLCGVPALATGLLFWRRLAERKHGSLQTAGVAAGVGGAVIMAAAAVAAWPEPALLLPVAAMIVLAFAWVAWWFGIPAALVPAGVALVGAWLVAFHVAQGNVTWTLADDGPMKAALVSAASGHALVPLVGLFGLGTWLTSRAGRREDGRMVALVAAATAVLSLALVLWFGFGRSGDPAGATWTLAIYAVAALAAAAYVDRPVLAGTGAALLLLTLVQGIAFRFGEALDLERPHIVALLTHAALMVAGYIATRRRPRRHVNLATVLKWWAAVSSGAAAGLLAVQSVQTSAAALAGYLAWLAVVWLVLAVLANWQVLFSAAHVVLVLAIFAGVTALVTGREWYVAALHPWLDPWFLAAQGVALAGYALVCAGVRWYFQHNAEERGEFAVDMPPPDWYVLGKRLMNPPWPAADHAVEAALVGLVVLVALYAALPGVAQELALPGVRSDGTALREVTPIERLEIAGIAHEHAAGWGTWLLLGSVLAVVVAGLWRRHAVAWRLGALVVILAMTAPLVAARWEPEVAVASAWRWLSAGLFAMASVVVWFGGRWHAFDWLESRAAGTSDTTPMSLVSPGRHLRDLWVLVTGLMYLALAPQLTAAVLNLCPVVGPEPGSWFRAIGTEASYGVPLVVIALALVGYAIRDRASSFALCAGLLANVVATMVVVMREFAAAGLLDAAAWITLAQVNAVVSGAVALVWLAAVYVGRARPPALLVEQGTLAGVLCAAFLLPAAVGLAMEPVLPPAWVAAGDGALGWFAVALGIAAAVWLNRPVAMSISALALCAAAVVILVALTALRWDTGNWLAYHTLLAGACAAAWVVPAVGAAWRPAGELEVSAGGPPAVTVGPAGVWTAPLVRLLAVAAVVLALRALDGGPQRPWWTVGALAAISLRNVWIAWREGGRGAMWLAAVLANLAVSIWWVTHGYKLTATTGSGRVVEFVWTNAIAAAALAVIAALVEPRIAARPLVSLWIGFHRFAAWAIAAVLLLFTGFGLAADLAGNPIEASAALGWAASVAALVAAVACWWDVNSRWPVACIYTVGLVAVGMYLDGLNFQSPMFQWALAMALASYALATSYLWSRRGEIGGTLSRLGVPLASAGMDSRGGQHWLVAANSLVAVAVVALVAWIEVTVPDFGRRMIAAYAVGAVALALALLARGTVRSALQYSAMVFGVLFAVAFGWAWLEPDIAAPWLHRTIAAIAALAAMMVVYGLGIVKVIRRENEWTAAAQRLVPLLAVIAAVLLLAVLAVEVVAFARGETVPLAWPALVAVVVALVGLAVAAIVAALVPGRDPLGLSERGRTVYVYAAEALAALAFLHIRVTMPWLFTGWFLRFWPLLVMVIAFAGVGLGEVFRRRRQTVLAEPLENTGALLPLLPALGFWVTASEVHYSLLLLSVGVLYAAVSVLRRSFWFAVLAAVAANGSLWFLLHERQGLSLAEHPQLWLIPPALCVLAAGYINRARLSPEQSATLRYASAIVIYVSSTADIFINGVAEAPWLPAVLAALSLLGVFAGILLRVRAFLYLGTAFLLVALLTIIWYAAVEQERTYIFWVAGIVTGVAIIVLFGIFEKRRDDVLRMVERLKHWEA